MARKNINLKMRIQRDLKRNEIGIFHVQKRLMHIRKLVAIYHQNLNLFANGEQTNRLSIIILFVQKVMMKLFCLCPFSSTLHGNYNAINCKFLQLQISHNPEWHSVNQSYNFHPFKSKNEQFGSFSKAASKFLDMKITL